MKALKKLVGSQGDEKKKTNKSSSSSAEQIFSQPALTPGFYGDFPAKFSIYFTGTSDDKKSDFFLLGTEGNGQIKPLYAFAVQKGMVKVQITLYSGPGHSSSPLGLAGNEKHFRSTSIIAIPAPSVGPETPTNQVERLELLNSIKYESARFSVVVGALGSANHQIETFEWRTDNQLKPQEDKPFERRLVRLNNSTKTGEEVVGTWTEEAMPEKGSTLGSFQFQGSGTTGELGPYWTLMAVMSLLRMNQVRWEGTVAAGRIIKAGGMLAGAGIGVAGGA